MNISNIEKAHIKVWINRINGLKNFDVDNLDWVTDKKDKILSYITKNKDYKLTSKRAHLQLLGKITKDENILDLAKTYQNQIEEQQKQNLIKDERKNEYIDFDTLTLKRDNLKKNWDNDPDNVKNHMMYLIVCLYTYIPPIRMNYIDMEMTTTKPPDEDDKKNYLYNNKGKWTLYVRNDKVAKKKNKEGLSSHVPLKEKMPEALNTILNKSYEILKRDYVLVTPTKKEQQMKKQTFENLLKQALSKNIGVDILRSIYVNHFLSVKRSLKERQELARLMRSSVNQQMKNYEKVETTQNIKVIDNENISQKDYNKIVDLLFEKIKNELNIQMPVTSTQKYKQNNLDKYRESTRKASKKYYDLHKKKKD